MKRRTSIALIILAIVSLVLQGLTATLLMTQWFMPLSLLIHLLFIGAVYFSMRLSVKESAKIMHWVVIGFLGITFIKNGLDQVLIMLGLGTVTILSLWALIEMGLAILLFAALFIVDLTTRRFNWMFLFAALVAILDAIFFIVIPQQWIMENMYSIYVLIGVDALWAVGAIIMGIGGLVRRDEARQLREVQNG